MHAQSRYQIWLASGNQNSAVWVVGYGVDYESFGRKVRVRRGEGGGGGGGGKRNSTQLIPPK